MQWYYQDATDRSQVAFDENYLAALVGDGRISPTTLVWAEGHADWVPAASAFPDKFPGVALPPGSAPPQSAPAGAPPTPSVDPNRTPSGAHLVQSTGKVVNEDLRELVKDFASYLNANRFWIKFLGVVMIIGGVAYALTVVGILVAWLPIWGGILLLQCARAAHIAENVGTEDSMAEALARLGLFLKINGIGMLIFVILSIVGTIVFFLLGGLAVLQAGPQELPML